MIYRENGQFKTNYTSDQQIFGITQDRWFVLGLMAFAAFVLPFLVDEYMFRAILIPFLILALATLGLNILTGYAGQISLGTAAFMAVGAFASYNFMLRVPGMPVLVAFVLGGICAALAVSLLEISGASRALTLRVRGWSQPAATAPARPIVPPVQTDSPAKRRVSVRVFDAPAQGTQRRNIGPSSQSGTYSVSKNKSVLR